MLLITMTINYKIVDFLNIDQCVKSKSKRKYICFHFFIVHFVFYAFDILKFNGFWIIAIFLIKKNCLIFITSCVSDELFVKSW